MNSNKPHTPKSFSFAKDSAEPCSQFAVPRIEARSEERARTARPGHCLGIPTVITELSKREKALQVIDSEGEITFFDQKTFATLQDAALKGAQGAKKGGKKRPCT